MKALPLLQVSCKGRFQQALVAGEKQAILRTFGYDT